MMNTQRRQLVAAIAAGLACPSYLTVAYAAESEKALPLSVVGGKYAELDFSSVFPVRFYQKSYFGLSLLVASMVAAGVFSYVTAGAGAPSAAFGVSSVASWVAGGGAGSYMAGLSTIGGWFGGNAMLGSAILNGISLGAVGTGTVGAGWTTVATMSKVVTAAAVSATVMDGVALFKAPDTQALQVSIDLPVPVHLGSGEVRDLAEGYRKQSEVIRQLLADLGVMAQEGIAPEHAKMKAAREKLDYYQESNQLVLRNIAAKIRRDRISGQLHPADIVVHAVISRIEGDYETFSASIDLLKGLPLKRKSYLSYLMAIAALDAGDADSAKDQLWNSLAEAPYALEPAALLINLLAVEGFSRRENAIVGILQRAEKNFSVNAYRSSLSLVSLNYRLATNYLAMEDYKNAVMYFDRAYQRFGRLQRFSTSMGWGSESGGMAYNPLIPVVLLGKANAMYGLGEREQANAFFCEDVLSRAGGVVTREDLTGSYFGGVELVCA